MILGWTGDEMMPYVRMQFLVSRMVLNRGFWYRPNR
jgi:hypothetical protein